MSQVYNALALSGEMDSTCKQIVQSFRASERPAFATLALAEADFFEPQLQNTRQSNSPTLGTRYSAECVNTQRLDRAICDTIDMDRMRISEMATVGISPSFAKVPERQAFQQLPTSLQTSGGISPRRVPPRGAAPCDRSSRNGTPSRPSSSKSPSRHAQQSRATENSSLNQPRNFHTREPASAIVSPHAADNPQCDQASSILAEAAAGLRGIEEAMIVLPPCGAMKWPASECQLRSLRDEDWDLRIPAIASQSPRGTRLKSDTPLAEGIVQRGPGDILEFAKSTPSNSRHCSPRKRSISPTLGSKYCAEIRNTRLLDQALIHTIGIDQELMSARSAQGMSPSLWKVPERPSLSLPANASDKNSSQRAASIGADAKKEPRATLDRQSVPPKKQPGLQRSASQQVVSSTTGVRNANKALTRASSQQLHGVSTATNQTGNPPPPTGKAASQTGSGQAGRRTTSQRSTQRSGSPVQQQTRQHGPQTPISTRASSRQPTSQSSPEAGTRPSSRQPSSQLSRSSAVASTGRDPALNVAKSVSMSPARCVTRTPSQQSLSQSQSSSETSNPSLHQSRGAPFNGSTRNSSPHLRTTVQKRPSSPQVCGVKPKSPVRPVNSRQAVGGRFQCPNRATAAPPPRVVPRAGIARQGFQQC